MATLSEMVLTHTHLGAGDLEWLHRLLGEWQLLADLSFADLLLWVPMKAELGEAPDFMAVAQMRPTTGPTSLQEDLVGRVAPAGTRPLIDDAFALGRVCREGDPEWRGDVPVREEAIPVRHAGRVVAVVARLTNLANARTPSRLEITYLQAAAELAQMIAEGRFPVRKKPGELQGEARAGDGLIRIDEKGVVQFASPNAVSAYSRLGLTTGDLLGQNLADVTTSLVHPDGPMEEPISTVVQGHAYREREFETPHAVIQFRTIPLSPGGRGTGALILVRDVSELRLLDRRLLSKDATIREIHHRVKNNLQTVAALLRLQARRVDVPEARNALAESVRRVSSIALVHETLSQSHDAAEVVDFDAIVDQLFAMVAEVAGIVGEVRRHRVGAFGRLPSQVATPLALVLAELLQNAIEHGLPDGGFLEVDAARDEDKLNVWVRDDGLGLPAGFALESSPSLGLQIARTLVEGELGGRISLAPREPQGTEAHLAVPLPTGAG